MDKKEKPLLAIAFKTLVLLFVLNTIPPPGWPHPSPGQPPIGKPPQIINQFQQQVWKTEIPATIKSFNY